MNPHFLKLIQNTSDPQITKETGEKNLQEFLKKHQMPKSISIMGHIHRDWDTLWLRLYVSLDPCKDKETEEFLDQSIFCDDLYDLAQLQSLFQDYVERRDFRKIKCNKIRSVLERYAEDVRNNIPLENRLYVFQFDQGEHILRYHLIRQDLEKEPHGY